MRKVIYLLIVIVLAVGCGEPEKSDFEKAKEQNTVDSYVNFIKAHPQNDSLIAKAKIEIGNLLGKISFRTVDPKTKKHIPMNVYITGGNKEIVLDSLIAEEFKSEFDFSEDGVYSFSNLTPGYYNLFANPGDWTKIIKLKDSIYVNWSDNIDLGSFEISRK